MEDRTRGWTPVKEGPGMSQVLRESFPRTRPKLILGACNQSTLSSVAFQSPAAHSAAESEVPQRRAVVPASASPTRLQAPLPPPSGGSPEKKTGVGIVFKERNLPPTFSSPFPCPHPVLTAARCDVQTINGGVSHQQHSSRRPSVSSSSLSFASLSLIRPFLTLMRPGTRTEASRQATRCCRSTART
eukprot:2054151-Rhodomonas_salina.4